MINLFHKKKSGAATLIVTVILLVLISLLALFMANFNLFQRKIVTNTYKADQALGAAEAGLQFAIPYLTKFKTYITSRTTGGFLRPYADNSIANVSLGNGSKFTATYSNPTANNYNLILVTSTGTDKDGSATRTVQQLVQYTSQTVAAPPTPIVSIPAINLDGNVDIINQNSDNTIQSGGAVQFSGNSKTTLSSGESSNKNGTLSDVSENNSALSSLTPTELFNSYFGSTESTIKSSLPSNSTHSASSSKNYNSVVAGVNGQAIWIDQNNGTASINGNTTIGTISNPTVLIINGNAALSGNLKIYGLLYVLGGAVTINGYTKIYGSVVGSSTMNISGDAEISYDPTILGNIDTGAGKYVFVPGSWKDFT